MKEKIISRREMLGSDGKVYEVVEIQEYVSSGLGSWVPGMRRLELEDGREVILLNNRDTIEGTSITLSAADD